MRTRWGVGTGLAALGIWGVIGVAAEGPLLTRKPDQKLPFVLTAAVRTAEAPTLDGKLEEACWAQAAVAGDFVLYGGKGYPSERTEARVLWDDAHLYIGMRCFDPAPGGLRKTVTDRDGPVFQDDCIEIFFIPPKNPILARFSPSERYFHIAVNALGTCWDEIGMNSPDRWTAPWTARTSIHADRWEVEIALPWDAIRSWPMDGEVWAINFNRGRPRRQKETEGQYSGWSLTFAGFHDPEHFGKLLFLERWPQAGAKEISPEVVARLVRGAELEPLLEAGAHRVRQADAVLHALKGRTAAGPIHAAAEAAAQMVAQAEALRRGLDALEAPQLVATWEARRDQYAEFLRQAEALGARADFYADLTADQLAGAQPMPEFAVFVLPAITNDRVLPRQMPAHRLKERTLRLVACPNEYESGSFGLYALSALKDVRLSISDLRGPEGTVPAAAADLRVVKVWYQAGRNVGFQNLKLLTPELLLKDDSLVRLDETRQVNVLKMDKDAMRDADTLQPFEVPAGTVKQCWVTVHVPADARAGVYEGAIDIRPAQGAGRTLPVVLRVLPFELEEPKIICSIYYRATLGAQSPACTSEAKTEEQLLAEFRDLRAHGVTNPTCYQGPGPALERYLQLRAQAGLRGGPFLTLGTGVGSPEAVLKETLATARKHGFTDVYVYAADEATGDELKAQRAAFGKVHQAGAKVFVAGYTDSFELVGDLLDLPIFAGKPDAALGGAYHRMGHRIGSYGNPQGGVEEPATYRRNFGLGLWKAGYDCAMTYAYMHSFHHAWDDYDDPVYRDHNMAYPTVNGVIPTLQWEGYREGYDDLRYVATLENLIEKAKRLDGRAGEAARAAQVWLLRVDPEATPPEDIRAGIVERILAIRDALGQAPR